MFLYIWMKFASQNLRNAPQIGKCQLLICSYHQIENKQKGHWSRNLWSLCPHACRMFIMQVLVSQLHFLANQNAGLAIPSLFWPVNCIQIGGHVALLNGFTVHPHTVTLLSVCLCWYRPKIKIKLIKLLFCWSRWPVSFISGQSNLIFDQWIYYYLKVYMC